MKRLAYAAAAVLLAAALLVLLAPLFIDTPAVRAEIQRRLSRAVDGQVAWEALEIAFFPAPRGELRRVRLEIPGKLSAAAEGLDVYLRLWPLLRGRPEISSVTVVRPQVRITSAEGTGRDAPPDAVALYRAAIEPAARALQEFAPEMVLRMEGAALDLDPVQLREVNASARTGAKGVDLELAATSNLWKRLSVEGRVDYADFAAQARVALDELVFDKEIPAATLRGELRTDGKTAVECEFDASLGSIATAKGKLALPAGKPPVLAANLNGVDVAQAIALARRKAPVLDVIESAEGRLSAKADLSLGTPWQLQLDVVRSDAAVKLTPLPWKLAAHAGRVTVTPEWLRVTAARGAVGDSTFENAAAQVDFGKNPRLSGASGRATLKLGQWFAWLQTKLPLEDIASASGTVDVALNRLALRFDRPAEVDFDAVATPRDVTAVLRALPQPVRIADGAIHADAKRVRVGGLRGSLGNSVFSGVAAQIELGNAPRVSSASGNATLRLEQWFPWLQTKVPLDDIASLSGSVEVSLSRLALRFDRPAEVDFDATVAPQKVSAALKMLPAAVSADGGSVRAGPKEIGLKNVAVAMLDARALVSGSFSLKDSALELALAEGSAGEKIVRWAMERGEVAARLEPRTPLRFAAQRIAWAPKRGLEVDARLDFEGGPAVAAALAWRPELLELRRLAIKDAGSDAVLSATVGADLIQAGFSGTFQGRSIAAMLRQPPSDSGSAQGELRVTIDRKQPQRTFAEGKLRIEALDLSWLASNKAVIERADISSERTGLRVNSARFGWEDQFFELRGEARRTDAGPVVDARIESAGVLLDRLLPQVDPNAPKKKASPIWPLPLTGRIELSTGFVRYKEYRIEPFAGILSLERERARLEVKEARMCGVSFPMEVEVQPEQSFAAAHVRIKNEPLERTVHCLTGGGVQLTGNADLTAELRTQGQRPHLIRGLTGTLQTELRQGRVKKFALLGNILSFRGISSFGEMKEDGFPYRRMTAKGRFERGEFLVDEAFFDSDAVRFAASGRVDLLGANSQLTVLVGLLTRVDRIAGAIPIIGDVFGGSMTALPMAVHGDIRDPVIVPLGPRAVTDQLLGIFERTLKLPGKLVPAEKAKP